MIFFLADVLDKMVTEMKSYVTDSHASDIKAYLYSGVSSIT